MSLNKQKQELNSMATKREDELLKKNKNLENEMNEVKQQRWTSKAQEEYLARRENECDKREKNFDRELKEYTMQAEKALKVRQMDFEDKLDKIYAEKLETLKKANTRLVRKIGIKVFGICAVLACVMAVCNICTNKTVQQKKTLQAVIDEANEANWYLCSNRVMVYDVEHQQMAKYVMDGRAVQVNAIGDEWVEIKSQGLIGYITRADFDDFFFEISLNIG